MSDFPDGSILREAVSGKWYRTAPGVGRATLLIDLPNKILLAINVSSKLIEILVPDKENIYQRAGDLTFTNENNEAKVQLFSESLKEIELDNNGAKISNNFSDITSVLATLDPDMAKQWWSKRLPDNN
ncbi:hypothetical protein [Metabacillus fastidiosus]|uniref:hypothetical protein n=1 Tax=Metabacillus fastidiosus TaxID=1458 RepID=UPI003D290E6F